MVHENAIVEKGASIGKRTRVWAFAHILSGAKIGDDCNICDHTFIEGKVVVGDRVTLKCGVYLWDGINIEDDVFVGPGAVFTNDRKPRSRKYPSDYLKTHLREGCSIGANSTVLAGLTIGCWSMVGAGSVVTRSVPDFGVVWGNPARFQYWICRCAETLKFDASDVATCQCGARYRVDSDIVRICL